ncbi:MAG: biotin--[acetyl-CoA-carboxylase] ligase [Planctomycetota bacterium]
MNRRLDLCGEPSSRLLGELGRLIDEDIIGSARCSTQTNSTNQDAINEWQQSEVAATSLPRLHITESQTAGRGRRGRTWVSDDTALTFSLVIDADTLESSIDRYAWLSIAVGVGAAEALEFYVSPRQIGIKWPNDLCIASGSDSIHKLGGILIESASATIVNRRKAIVIGIGINLNQAPDIADGFPAASLSQWTNRPIERHEIVHSVVQSVIETLADWASDDSSLLRRIQQRCVLTGKQITLRQLGDDVDEIIGHCLGISQDGSLMIDVQGRKRSFITGEIASVRLIR